MRYGRLKDLRESLGERQLCDRLARALQEGKIKAEEFSLRELAETFIGPEWVKALQPSQGGELVSFLEAGEAVSVTTFSNITGQIIYNQLIEAYQQAGMIGMDLVRVVPTRLSGERIAGISQVKEEGQDIHEGMPYPSASVGEDYIDTPVTTKRGMIIPITREAIFFDRTGLILDRARTIGERLGMEREAKILRTILGVDNSHVWRGTSYNTYQTSTPWNNDVQAAANALTDWTSIDTILNKFTETVDPDTGRPIVIGGMQLLVMPSKLMTARRIVNATEIREGTSSLATVTISANPVSGIMGVYSSAVARQELVTSGVSAADAATYWFLGDFKRAFMWMENWPLTVVQAPSNSEAEFTQDIVTRFKASYRGVTAVKQPRAVQRARGHA